MATVAKRVGRGPCPNCGESVTFKCSAGQLLNFRCDACCSTGYCEPGGSCDAAWSKTIKPFVVGEGTRPDLGLEPVKPVPDYAPPTPAARASKAFSMADL